MCSQCTPADVAAFDQLMQAARERMENMAARFDGVPMNDAISGMSAAIGMFMDPEVTAVLLAMTTLSRRREDQYKVT